MKKIILILFISFSFASCEKWLDVRPYDRLEKDKVFPDERTTNSALNGLYISLAEDDLYGKEMSCGMLEILAQHFMVPQDIDHRYYYLNSFDYANAKTSKVILSNTFQKSYKLIAACNDFLYEVEKYKNDYTTDKYNLYCGEALALRTLVHFDMLRLFGPVAAEKDRDAVPYYNVSTDTPKPILTANDMVDALLADISQAIQFLKNDPVLTVGVDETNSNIDFFTGYRNARLNYYAACALKARILLYKGDAESKTEAYQLTSRMLEGVDPLDPSKRTTFNDEFKLIKTRQTDFVEHVFVSELLFALNNDQRKAVNRSLFSTELSSQKILSGGQAYYNYLYNTATTVGGIDAGIRSKIWSFDSGLQTYIFNRLATVVENVSYPYYNQFQGMIRLGEVYLIAAECAPSVELKRSWLEALRAGKGYDPGNAAGLNETQLNALISVEFARETYGEGQFFFFAKRRNENLRNYNNATVKMSRETFVPPLPDGETDYRNRNKQEEE